MKIIETLLLCKNRIIIKEIKTAYNHYWNRAIYLNIENSYLIPVKIQFNLLKIILSLLQKTVKILIVIIIISRITHFIRIIQIQIVNSQEKTSFIVKRIPINLQNQLTRVLIPLSNILQGRIIKEKISMKL